MARLYINAMICLTALAVAIPWNYDTATGKHNTVPWNHTGAHVGWGARRCAPTVITVH